jgi:hypothetical protein
MWGVYAGSFLFFRMWGVYAGSFLFFRMWGVYAGSFLFFFAPPLPPPDLEPPAGLSI